MSPLYAEADLLRPWARPVQHNLPSASKSYIKYISVLSNTYILPYFDDNAFSGNLHWKQILSFLSPVLFLGSFLPVRPIILQTGTAPFGLLSPTGCGSPPLGHTTPVTLHRHSPQRGPGRGRAVRRRLSFSRRPVSDEGIPPFRGGGGGLAGSR